MNIIGIIPARMGSSRFPGKPLAKICGIPMIGHVFFRSKMSNILDEVYVATCDNEIRSYVQSVGGKAIMTSSNHQRASDRTAEALLQIEENTGKQFDIVVMLQGDEPLIKPQMIEAAVAPLINDPSINVSNLMAELKEKKNWIDPNEVKVVIDNNNFALYFSREPIPSDKKYNDKITAYKQVCVIPFTRECLLNYIELKPTSLEIIESVDMNRFLENGIKVKMVLTTNETYAVDTTQDLIKVERIMSKDPLVKSYLK